FNSISTLPTSRYLCWAPICPDARDQRGALHCPFNLVRALPLLWFYQNAERFTQLTERIFARNPHDYDSPHSCAFCHCASSVLGTRQACGTAKDRASDSRRYPLCRTE